jgi:predicted aldo/keto reductase-like oxidoreductase
MNEKQNEINRRNFLKTMGAAGLGSVFASAEVMADSKKAEAGAGKKEQETPKFPQVPRRKLGKTGVDVPILSLGAMFNIVDNQIILRSTLQWGVNYWDTAHGYARGNSEIGIGNYLEKNPEVRKNVFIVTKASDAETPAEIEKRLKTSLERMNTDYIDLFYGVHGLDEPEQLTGELKKWVLDAKKRKKIRFFGFSTHNNMPECLMAASKVGWVDALMTTYNFRVMQDPKMNAAVEACNKAGVGLIAMKTMSGRQKIKTEEDKKLAGHFLERGFTQGQAKIKAVLDDKRFSSACVQMRSVARLTENAAAALDKTKLTQADMDVFKEHAKETCSSYCAGCGHICSSALPQTPCISKVMRYLMYHNSYGERDRARELFAQIPASVRNNLLSIDYSAAEARCPQHMPIAELIAEAVTKLA